MGKDFYYEHFTFVKFARPPPPSAKLNVDVCKDVRKDICKDVREDVRKDVHTDVRKNVRTDVRTDVCIRMSIRTRPALNLGR